MLVTPSPLSHRRTLWGTFLLSLSVLMFEVTLLRLFSVVMKTNLSFLAISVTLFGVAIGGVAVYVFARHFAPERLRQRLGQWLAAAAVGLALFPFLFLRLNFDAAHLRTLTLLIGLLLAAVPFVTANVGLTLIFRAESARFGRLYFADLLGAGSGVVAAVVLMHLLTAIDVIFVTAACACLALLAFGVLGRRGQAAVAVFAVLVAVVAGVNEGRSFVDLRYTRGGKEYDVTFSKWNSFSRVSVHEERDWLELWSLPADEQRSHGEVGVRIDADAFTSIVPFDGDFSTVEYLRRDLASLAYTVAPPGQSLVIGPGGGRDVLMALLHGYTVKGVEINPIIANDILGNAFREFSGDLVGRPDVDLVVAEGRSYLQRHNEQFNVITLPLVDTWSSTASGNLFLVESYLYTVEAFEQYLKHLTPDGVFAIIRWDEDGLRILSQFFAASERLGIEHPERNVIVGRNVPDAVTQLNAYVFKQQPITETEWERAKAFLEENGFSVLYSPFETTDNPYQRLANAPDRSAYQASLRINTFPVSDTSPFFFFRSWMSDIFRQALRGQTPHDGGLVGVFLIVVLLSAAVVLVPAMALRRQRRPEGSRRRTAAYLGYVAVLGVAFFLLEISFIQQFILYLEHPIYSYSVVLAALLVLAGIGSWWSSRFNAGQPAVYAGVGVVVGGLVLLDILWLKPFIDATITLPIAAKIPIAAGLTAPIALAMGMMLPLAMRRLGNEGRSSLIPWCWAVTGSTSVLASVLAIILGVVLGFQWVMGIAGVLYVFAWTLMALVPRPAPVGSQKR
ncbi:MAG: hypothetical protein HYZ09_00775 [Candidatus Kerfeldbacteria bacterium]|nr:hypothetical protein [Candidatus Kerfeldbacteria bacterium]